MKKVGKALSDSALANGLLRVGIKLTRQAVTKKRQQGMPNVSVAAAAEWYHREVNSGQQPGDQESLNDLRKKLIAAQEEGQRLKNRIAEFELREIEQRLVPETAAHEVIETALGPVLRSLEGMEQSLKVKCNPSDPNLAGTALREWSTRVRKQMSKALDRCARKKEKLAAAA